MHLLLFSSHSYQYTQIKCNPSGANFIRTTALFLLFRLQLGRCRSERFYCTVEVLHSKNKYLLLYTYFYIFIIDLHKHKCSQVIIIPGNFSSFMTFHTKQVAFVIIILPFLINFAWFSSSRLDYVNFIFAKSFFEKKSAF